MKAEERDADNLERSAVWQRSFFSVELGVWSVEFKEVSACADKYDSRRDVGIAPYKDSNPVGQFQSRGAHLFFSLFSLHSSLYKKITLPLGRVILFR